MEMPGYPPGVMFRPTEVEMLTYYLPKKIRGEEIPAVAPLKEMDFYEKEPWKIVSDLGYSEQQSLDIDIYFFSRVKKKFSTGKRADRIVGSGSWKLEKTTAITVGSVLIGSKRPLSFHLSDKSKARGKSWVMHEYVLPDDSPGSQEWTISRVHRGRATEEKSSSPPLPLKRPAEDYCITDDHHQLKRPRPYAQASAAAASTSKCIQQPPSHCLPQASSCGDYGQHNQQIANQNPSQPHHAVSTTPLDDQGDDVFGELLANFDDPFRYQSLLQTMDDLNSSLPDNGWSL